MHHDRIKQALDKDLAARKSTDAFATGVVGVGGLVLVRAQPVSHSAICCVSSWSCVRCVLLTGRARFCGPWGVLRHGVGPERLGLYQSWWQAPRRVGGKLNLLGFSPWARTPVARDVGVSGRERVESRVCRSRCMFACGSRRGSAGLGLGAPLRQQAAEAHGGGLRESLKPMRTHDKYDICFRDGSLAATRDRASNLLPCPDRDHTYVCMHVHTSRMKYLCCFVLCITQSGRSRSPSRPRSRPHSIHCVEDRPVRGSGTRGNPATRT